MAKKVTKSVENLSVAPMLSKEQVFVKELFGSGSRAIFNNPDSECLPKVHGALFTGFGLINNDDTERETGGMFGLK